MTFLTLMLAACTYDPTVGTLPDNVNAAFERCEESQINFLARKHNFQAVFEPCGNNRFRAFSWAPDGRRIYFQLGQTGYVMNAEADTKPTITVPIPPPIGAATWLSANRLAIPVGPDATDEGNRVAVFDIDQKSVFYQPVPHARVPAGWATSNPGEVLLVVQDAAEDPNKPLDGPKSLVRVSLEDGSTSAGFPWLTDPFDTFTITPSIGLAAIGRGTTVSLYDIETGALEGSHSPATRGTVHSEGRWLVLEHLGEPISIFYQRAWDEMSEQQRRREQQRAERMASKVASSYPTTVQPPTLSLVDRKDGARWMFTSVYGTDFQWYEAQHYYASFIFWGFEGKQFRRNVMLGQFGTRIRATEIGRDFMGVVPMNDAARSRKIEEPSPRPSTK